MAYAQKPDFVFRQNGRVHLNRQGASVQSTTGSRGVRISGSNAGYTMFRVSVKGTGYPLHSQVFPFTFPPVRHRVPSHFNWSLPLRFAKCDLFCWHCLLVIICWKYKSLLAEAVSIACTNYTDCWPSYVISCCIVLNSYLTEWRLRFQLQILVRSMTSVLHKLFVL